MEPSQCVLALISVLRRHLSNYHVSQIKSLWELKLIP